jgi:hypothetical protein
MEKTCQRRTIRQITTRGDTGRPGDRSTQKSSQDAANSNLYRRRRNLLIFLSPNPYREFWRKFTEQLKKDEDNWRIRTNWELDTLTGWVNIVRYIKAQRLRWFGHIQRTEDDRMVKKLTNWKPFGKRPAGRPKCRWIDGILKDMQVLKVKNWKESTRNRKEWNKLVEKAKTHFGL